MYRKFNQALSYLQYILVRKGRHGIHSPFVYEFVDTVLHDKMQYPAYKIIEKARNDMFNNHNLIETVDFGALAGKKKFLTYREKVSVLAKKRTHSLHYNHLLFRIVNYFQPSTILEFGTSTGASTISMALGNQNALLVTMEGCASISSVAQDLIEKTHINNVKYVIGNFNKILEPTLQNFEKLDLIFVDGNHRKEPTIRYFLQCLSKKGEESVFIFDDIHYSNEMEEAWEIIKKNETVTLTMDLFQFGIVFFRKGIEKQHFVLSIS